VEDISEKALLQRLPISSSDLNEKLKAGLSFLCTAFIGGMFGIAGICGADDPELASGFAAWGFGIGGVCLSAGIPMVAVGTVKKKNREHYYYGHYSYNSCITQEFDFGEFALAPSVGYTRDFCSNTNTPSVGLAIRF